MAYEIYTGFWTDWSRGAVNGATFTLSQRSGLLLLAFSASFVTFVATRLWRILRFTVHQLLAKSSTNDGIHFQRQSILRNSNTPLTVAWESIQQAWYWRGAAGSNACAKTIPTAMVALLYACGFIVAAIFSSHISDAATPYRLIRQDEKGCGFVVPDFEDRNTLGDTGRSLLEIERLLNREAESYVSSCYQSEASFSNCDLLPVRSISWTRDSIACPFGDLCVEGVKAIRLDTGRIQSTKHLGINQPSIKREDYRRVTECSPLKPRFEPLLLPIDNCTVLQASYGTMPVIDSNWTDVYLSCDANIGVWQYTLRSIPSTSAAVGEQWTPLPPLNSTSRDMTLLIYSNSLRFLSPNTDPLFGTDPDARDMSFVDGIPRFLPASLMTALACADMHQFCNPTNDQCTELADVKRLTEWGSLGIGLSVVQQAISNVLVHAAIPTLIDSVVNTRPHSALLVSTRYQRGTMLSVSNSQWEIEVSKLFNESIAKLQHAVMSHAAGPPLLPPNLHVEQRWKDPDEVLAHPSNGFLGDLCSAQLVRDAKQTLSFSVLGLGIILGGGLLIMVVSFVVEPVAEWAQGKSGRGVKRGRARQQDGNLQMQRLLFEERGQGDWIGVADPVPRTRTRTILKFSAEENS